MLRDKRVLFAVGTETELVNQLIANHFLAINDHHLIISPAADVHDVLPVAAENDLLVNRIVKVPDFIVLGAGLAIDDDGEAAAADGNESDVVPVRTDHDALRSLILCRRRYRLHVNMQAAGIKSLRDRGNIAPGRNGSRRRPAVTGTSPNRSVYCQPQRDKHARQIFTPTPDPAAGSRAMHGEAPSDA
jgi:hypothetical protein